MQTREVQRWGVLIGGFAIAAALLAASRTDPSGTEPTAPAAVKVAPIPPNGGASQEAPSSPGAAAAQTPASAVAPLFEPAGQGGAASSGNVSFLVRFGASHPLARAQDLARQGKHSDAARTARTMIAGRADLRGLCFDRFTLGGAEIVLRACDAVPSAQRETFQRNWTSRLGAMPGIEYAEPNYILQPEKGR